MAINNNVTLIGRLTKDVELKKTTSGLSVASFTLACNKKVNGQNEADFINCVAWKQSAEYLNNYAGKGSLIALNGRISTRSYDNQQGQRVYVTEVVADNVSILASNNNQQPTQPVQQTEPTFPECTIDINADDLPF